MGGFYGGRPVSTRRGRGADKGKWIEAETDGEMKQNNRFPGHCSAVVNDGMGGATRKRGEWWADDRCGQCSYG